jgi:hypothetical protein
VVSVARLGKIFEIVVEVVLKDRTAEYAVERTIAEMVGMLKVIFKEAGSREA